MPDKNSELREIVGQHLAQWRGTTPLEDFANVDDVYRTLMPALENYLSAHTTALLDRVAEEAIGYDEKGTVSGGEFVREATTSYQDTRNLLRAEQRTALSQIRKELL